jgi:hypothetical protein
LAICRKTVVLSAATCRYNESLDSKKPAAEALRKPATGNEETGGPFNMSMPQTASATVRCRCCRTRVPADQIQQDGTCTGCSAPAPRFEVVRDNDGQPTVRDNERGQVVTHEAPWVDDLADLVAERLNEVPAYRVCLHWTQVPA